jgi:nucleoid DNA-binding protein
MNLTKLKLTEFVRTHLNCFLRVAKGVVVAIHSLIGDSLKLGQSVLLTGIGTLVDCATPKRVIKKGDKPRSFRAIRFMLSDTLYREINDGREPSNKSYKYGKAAGSKVNKKNFIDMLVKYHNLGVRQAQRLFDAILLLMRETLKKGYSVSITGVCTLRPYTTNSFTDYNMAGKTVEVPKKNLVWGSISKSFYLELNDPEVVDKVDDKLLLKEIELYYKNKWKRENLSERAI